VIRLQRIGDEDDAVVEALAPDAVSRLPDLALAKFEGGGRAGRRLDLEEDRYRLKRNLEVVAECVVARGLTDGLAVRGLPGRRATDIWIPALEPLVGNRLANETDCFV